jgi:hypothetical protein
MYWVIYSAVHIVECFVEYIIYWVPFYYPLKATFLLYLILPQTKGASVVYDAVIRPIARKIMVADAIDEKLGAAINKAENIATGAAASATSNVTGNVSIY